MRITFLAMVLVCATWPGPALALSGPDVVLGCSGPPVDSDHVTWAYSPPIDDAPARLLCAVDTIAALLGESPGAWGVAVRDLRTRETVLANPDRHFVAGSLYKLGVAAEAYARIDEGSLAPESVVLLSDQDVDPDYGGSIYLAGTALSVREAVRAMITQSDNGAALALVDRLGLNAVNRRFAALGMPETRLNYDAVTTPRDVLAYFSRLADGEVVSLNASNSLLRLLAAQEINDRIPAGLPVGGGWWVAHKTANIDDMIGDAGIVFTSNDDAYALVVLNEGLNTYSSAVQTIRAISQTVYRVMVPLEDQRAARIRRTTALADSAGS